MKNRDVYWRRYKKHCTQDNDTSVPFKVGTLGPHTVFPITISCPLYFLESHGGSEISLLSKVILVLGKARSCRALNLGCMGAESPGWFDVSPKHCMRCDAWASVSLWWSCQSPVAHSCGLLNHPNTFPRDMFKLNVKHEAQSLFYLFRHFECDNHTVHMLTQWCLLPPLTSTVKSWLFMHVHSSPLSLAMKLHQCHIKHSCNINNGWTSFR